MSSKVTLFNDIIEKLDSIKVENDNAIQQIGLWNNQFENEERETAFNYPCCFIEFTAINWESSNLSAQRTTSVGNVSKEQKGEDTIITLHVGFFRLDDATFNFPDIDLLTEAIYFVIQGLDSDVYNPLLRSEERQDTNHDGVIDWQIDFTTALHQTGELNKKLEKVKDTLVLKITKDLDIDVPTHLGVRTGDGKV